MSDLSKDSKKIVLKTADTIHLVTLSDIMYCEADRGYTNFYLVDKSRIMVSTTMGYYEELFRFMDIGARHIFSFGWRGPRAGGR